MTDARTAPRYRPPKSWLKWLLNFEKMFTLVYPLEFETDGPIAHVQTDSSSKLRNKGLSVS